ncbi:putative ABC transport system permease protein [Clostridium cavendishii DSM 21758]|uniref:Putative ABC transport system permease protein n=1 Tax=Clostridium cavendishii DSM 21758 TaxID=1121302 RepID=A0A1M6I534_9CLOT|nr:FtsX-like permease family protein [Clostridium cavendishii]SHJ29510.1 putative ABC transport system permease protein [Clostridium cavendishii DSM 21758]
MSIFNIAYNNFKNNIKVYTMFFISMVFSVVILSNFLVLMHGDTIKYIDKINSEHCSDFLKVITFILLVFMFFFIWYSSNIFLKKRKKEIGIYAFMGLDSYVIGKIYFLETTFIGLTSCLLGTTLGIVLSKFFQVIVLKVAGYNLDVSFDVTPRAIIDTIWIFMTIFLIITIKGFINIVRSRIIDLLNANKKQEKMPKVGLFIYLLSVISIAFIGYGYYLSTKGMLYIVIVTVLIVIGTYGLFAAVIPIIFNFLITKKTILYKGENIITINNLAYRFQKNYTTYATIAIIIAATTTVLGTAVSMKSTYDHLRGNMTLYTLSFPSFEKIDKDNILKIVSKNNEVKDTVYSEALFINEKIKTDTNFKIDDILVIKYDELIRILKINGEDEVVKNLSGNIVKEKGCIYIQKPGTIISLINFLPQIYISDNKYSINGKVNCKVFGTALDNSLIAVNNEEYEKLRKTAQTINFYGVRLKDSTNLQKVVKELQTVVNNKTTGIYYGEKDLGNIEWLKFIYAIGSFLFLVFILVTASIIYMKVYSDATEDRGKYKILLSIGVSEKDITKSIIKEVVVFYIIPLVVGAVHSYFAIKMEGDFLNQNLSNIYLISIGICTMVFGLCCIISTNIFKKIVTS